MPGFPFRRLFSALLVLVLAAPAWAESYDDGMAAYKAGNYRKALEIWGPLAENGDATAQYSLGKLIETGGGRVARDNRQAAKWYQQAAAQGVSSAQNNLGLMYAQGRGVPRDVVRAAELWRAAAEQGHRIAQFNLGLAYYRGEGVAEDAAEAVAWLRRSAESGLAEAQYALGQIIRVGLAGPADEPAALHWYEMAAAQDHDKARDQAARLRQAGVVPAAPPDTAMAMVGAAPGPGATKAAEATEPAAAAEPPPEPASTRDAPEPAAQAGEQVAAVPRGSSPAPPPEVAEEAPPLETSAGPKDLPKETETPPPVNETAPAVPQGEAPEQVAAAAPAAEANAAAAEAPYSLWLISHEERAAARQSLEALQARHPALFAAAPGRIAEAAVGEAGRVHRVLAGGLPSREAAEALCRRLRAEDPEAFCKVLAN